MDSIMTLTVKITQKLSGNQTVTYNGKNKTVSKLQRPQVSAPDRKRPSKTHTRKDSSMTRKPKRTAGDPQTIKALSIKQPWAGLIMAGIKTVENRSWSTMYSGTLAIVSSAKPDKQAMTDMRRKLGRLPDICNVNGAILGTVELTGMLWTADDGVAESDHPRVTQKMLDWWNDDGVGWIVERPKRLPSPIPYKGRLGLYNIPAEFIKTLS